MKDTVKRTESDFLHDLSSPTGALQLQLEFLREMSKAQNVDFEKVKEKIEKSVSLVKKISEIITSRRNEIKKDEES